METVAGALAIRSIEARDDAAIAAIIRAVMPEFGADGPGFSGARTALQNLAHFVTPAAGAVLAAAASAPAARR